MAKPAHAAFAGFDRDAIQFLHELTAEMNREWFEANKARYQRVWAEPMAALLAEVAAKLAPAYKPVRLGPPKLFRIYRDTRFSKDKAPYKTHVAGSIAAGEGRSALYLHLGVDEEWVGSGTYYFEDPQLKRWRTKVAGKTGAELQAIIGKLRKAGYDVGGHDDYKKVPKPYAPDHPRAELLKMKGLTAGMPPIPKGLLHRPGLVAWIVAHARATAPMVKWLHRNVR